MKRIAGLFVMLLLIAAHGNAATPADHISRALDAMGGAEALAKLKESTEDFVYLLVGDGEMKSVWQKHAETFGVADKVKPNYWLIHYRGRCAAPTSGQFRFVGKADDLDRERQAPPRVVQRLHNFLGRLCAVLTEAFKHSVFTKQFPRTSSLLSAGCV